MRQKAYNNNYHHPLTNLVKNPLSMLKGFLLHI